jgi:hypothetical protein
MLLWFEAGVGCCISVLRTTRGNWGRLVKKTRRVMDISLKKNRFFISKNKTNMENSKYIRVAANVSDTFYIDEAKAVAFPTSPVDDNTVRNFVNNPDNDSNVFEMMNAHTFQPVTPEQNLYQANVVAFITRDTDGDPIQNRSYSSYVVTKNRGGYQLVKSV